MKLLILHPVSIWSLDRFLVAAEFLNYNVTILTANPDIFDEKIINRCQAVIQVSESTENPEDLMIQVISKDFDVVIAGSEFAVVSADLVADNLGCYSNDVELIRSARNKRLMRLAFKQQGLPQPEVLGNFKDETGLNIIEQNGLKYPLVIKPADMLNSLFVTICHDNSELRSIAKKIFDYSKFDLVKHSFTGEVLLEEFAEGDEYSVEALIKEGKLIFRNVTKKMLSPFPNRFEIGHIVGDDILSDLHHEIDQICEKIAHAWGMPNGVIHLEIKEHNGIIKIIEAAARIPGDRISALIELKYGISLEQGYIYLRDKSHNDIDFLNIQKQSGYFAVKFLFENDMAKLSEPNMNVRVIDQQKYATNNNNQLREKYDVSKRIGHLIACSESLSELVSWELNR